MQIFSKLHYFVLIVGNARSGSTLLGSIIDAHPNVIIANETFASATFWRSLSRHDILDEIYVNSQKSRASASGRLSEGYDYSIQQSSTGNADVLVMGDKIWNPVTLLLHGDYSLIARLEESINVPIKIIHAIRNPLDVIATMHLRSKAPIGDRILWYFMHCDAVCAIYDHCRDSNFMNIQHENLIEAPDTAISKICDFIGVKPEIYPINSCKSILFDKPRKTRFKINWYKNDIEEIFHRMSQYSFLQNYAVEDYSNLQVINNK